MKISILNAEGMDLTDAIRDYAQSKIDMLDKFVHDADESANISVQVGRGTNHHHKGDDIYFCELNLHLAGKDFNLKAEEGDLYAAIDMAKDEMSHVLSKHKSKQGSLVKRGGAAIKNMLRGFSK